MGTKKQKKRILKRKRATKAVKALGRRREGQVVDWLYEGYASHYQPEIDYEQYIEEYDDEIVKSVYGRCRSKNLNISYNDLETFYGMRRKRFKKRQAREFEKQLQRQVVRIVWLGTANAHAMNNYNSCFAVRNNKKTFLVDSGGGQYLIRQLHKAQIGYKDIHDIFITHTHLDHIMGLFFLLRDIVQHMKEDTYEGDLNIYGTEEVLNAIRETCKLLLENAVSYFDERIHFIPIHDGETFDIIDQQITFFDTHSEKKEQYGFVMKTMNDVTFAFLGDVPMVDEELKYVQGVDYFVHEAFCKNGERKQFRPYHKGHGTLKDACANFKKAGAKYLIITHTEDHLAEKRGAYYRREAAVDHRTMILIPDDLETIFLRKPTNPKVLYEEGEEIPIAREDLFVLPEEEQLAFHEKERERRIKMRQEREDNLVDELFNALSDQNNQETEESSV